MGLRVTPKPQNKLMYPYTQYDVHKPRCKHERYVYVHKDILPIAYYLGIVLRAYRRPIAYYGIHRWFWIDRAMESLQLFENDDGLIKRWSEQYD